MHVTRFDQAPAYEAPNHFDMRCLRLQGKEAGPSDADVDGHEPDPARRPHRPRRLAGREALPRARRPAHVVAELDGERDEQVLGPYDYCRFAPGEKRQLVNRSKRPVLVALVMANAPPAG